MNHDELTRLTGPVLTVFHEDLRRYQPSLLATGTATPERAWLSRSWSFETFEWRRNGSGLEPALYRSRRRAERIARREMRRRQAQERAAVHPLGRRLRIASS